MIIKLSYFQDLSFPEPRTKTASLAEAKGRDIELWKQWKRTGSQADLEALLAQVAPVIRPQVARWSRVAPEFLLQNEAKRLAIKAFNDYDPKQSALGTHVTNHLLKLSRTAYARQSTLTVPEAKRLNFNRINHEKTKLEDQLGHAPSIEELSDHLRTPVAHLQRLMSEVSKRELMESGEGPAFVVTQDDPDVIDLAYHDLTPVQQQIFEMRTGYNGVPIAKGRAIMKATGLSQGQLSHQVGKIKSTLQTARGLG